MTALFKSTYPVRSFACYTITKEKVQILAHYGPSHAFDYYITFNDEPNDGTPATGGMFMDVLECDLEAWPPEKPPENPPCFYHP